MEKWYKYNVNDIIIKTEEKLNKQLEESGISKEHLHFMEELMITKAPYSYDEYSMARIK